MTGKRKQKSPPLKGPGKPKLCRGCVPLKTVLWVDFARLHLDKRTKLFRTMANLKARLTKDYCSESPTLHQTILIDLAVSKCIRLHLYNNGYYSNADQKSEELFVRISNSLNRDLQVLKQLSVEQKAGKPKDIEDYIRKTYGGGQ